MHKQQSLATVANSKKLNLLLSPKTLHENDQFYQTGFSRGSRGGQLNTFTSARTSPSVMAHRTTLSPAQYMTRYHINPKEQNDFGDDGMPKPSELVLATQAIAHIEKDSDQSKTNQLMFRTFQKQCEQSNVITEIRQLPSPISRLNYVLLHNNIQKDYLRTRHLDSQHEAIDAIMIRMEARRQLEQRSEFKIKVRQNLGSMNQPKVQPKDTKKRVVIASQEQTQINLSTQSSGSNAQKELKLIAPQFYMETQTACRENIMVRPSFCEGSTLSIVGDKFYLFGGLGGNGMITSLYEYDLRICNQSWEIVKMQGTYPFEGRTGHSVLQYKNFLVYFGGSQMYNKRIKIRECFNQIYQFNLSTLQWSKPATQGEYIMGRRHHKVVLYKQKSMLVYGGIDSNENVLSDMIIYNLSRNVWKQLKGTSGPDLAYHSMINISYVQQKKNKTQEEGHESIYTFGGKDSKSQASNKLYQLGYSELTDQPDRWDEVLSKGSPPAPSYNNTMEYNHKLHGLIIIGGRTDEPQLQSEYSVLSAVHIFYLNYSTWQQVKMRGFVQSRCAHVSAMYGTTKIVVFGGIGNDRYLDAEVTVIEMGIAISWISDAAQVSHKIAREKTKSNPTHTDQPHHTSTMYNPHEHQSKHRKLDLWDEKAPIHSKQKRTLGQRFRDWQNEEHNFKSFLPVPKKKSPKIRYDLFIEFVRIFILKNKDAIFPQNQPVAAKQVKHDPFYD